MIYILTYQSIILVVVQMDNPGEITPIPSWDLKGEAGPILPNFLRNNRFGFRNSRNRVSHLNAKELEYIGADTMASNTGIDKFIAPEVKEIGDRAFRRSSITECNAPKTEAVHDYAFYASLIEKVDFPECVIVKERGFDSCTLLTCVILSTLVDIGEHAFSRCCNLKEVHGELKRVGLGAFCGCSELEYVNLSRCVHIDKSAFAYTRKLRDVVFSRNITFIGEYAFHNSGVRYVYIDAECCRISYAAFEESHVIYAFLNVYFVDEYILTKCNHLFWAEIHTEESLPGSSIWGCENLEIFKTSASVISGDFGLFCHNLRCLQTFAPYSIKEGSERDLFPDPRKCVIHNISSNRLDRPWFVIDPKEQQKRVLKYGYIKCMAVSLPMISAIRSEVVRFIICFILSVKKFKAQRLYENVPTEMLYLILSMLPWNACLGNFFK